jgi:hypothetical protein
VEQLRRVVSFIVSSESQDFLMKVKRSPKSRGRKNTPPEKLQPGRIRLVCIPLVATLASRPRSHSQIYRRCFGRTICSTVTFYLFRYFGVSEVLMAGADILLAARMVEITVAILTGSLRSLGRELCVICSCYKSDPLAPDAIA